MSNLLLSIVAPGGSDTEFSLLSRISPSNQLDSKSSGGFSSILNGQLESPEPELLNKLLASFPDDPRLQALQQQAADGKGLPPLALEQLQQLAQLLAAQESGGESGLIASLAAELDIDAQPEDTTDAGALDPALVAAGLLPVPPGQGGSEIATQAADRAGGPGAAGSVAAAVQQALEGRDQRGRAANTPAAVQANADAGVAASNRAAFTDALLPGLLTAQAADQAAELSLTTQAAEAKLVAQAGLLTGAAPAGQTHAAGPMPAALAELTAAPTTSSTPAHAQLSLDMPLRQPGWDQGLGERLVWMMNQKTQGAEIRLNPPQLGPIEVQIKVSNDQASVVFSAQHGAVRDALEAAIPRLREMLGSQGMELVSVNVSQQSLQQQQQQAMAGFSGNQAGGQSSSSGDHADGMADEGAVNVMSGQSGGLGMVDIFA